MLNRIRTLTLHDFCLQVVAENLLMFIHSKNVPQSHIDFLLRHYSDDVFRVINYFHGIKEETMLWFLNPQCKNVTLPIVSKNIIQRLQVVGPAITSLNLSNTLAKGTMLNSIICCIPNVTQLNLSSSLCCDKTLLCVQEKCCSLITLNLHDCQQITDNGMENLSYSVLQLQNLNLIGTSVTFKGLSKILKGIQSLQCLKHDDLADSLYNIHKSSFDANVHYNLTELIYKEDSSTCNPVDVLQAWTTMCPKVTKVHITMMLTKEILELCSKFKHLTDLKLKFTGSRDHKILSNNKENFVTGASMLTSLTLRNLEINIVTLLQCCKNLQTLCLRSVSFTEYEKIELKENKIKVLTIKDFVQEIPANYKSVSLLLSLSKSVTDLAIRPRDYDPHSKDGIELLDVVLNSMKNLSSIDLKRYDILRIDYNYLCRFFKMPSLQIIYSVDVSRFTGGMTYREYPASSLEWQDCYYYSEKFVIPGFQNFPQITESIY